MIDFPEPPEVPEGQIGLGHSGLRFEDVAQDGRLRIEGVWPPIGPILWGKLEVAQALLRLGARGIRAVLSYVILEGGSEPVSVRERSEHEVRWRVAHTVDATGALNRLVFDTWITSHAPRGVPNNPAQPAVGGRVRVARGYGQHVLTMPGAPPGQHRVLRLEDPLLPAVPADRVAYRDPASLMALPSGAEPLEPAPALEPAACVFGLSHTDGNQHVNFLAYPRMAEEAALRRLVALGSHARRLARRAEVGYRKPCFAGDVVRLAIQAFRVGEEVGAVVAFLPEAAAPSGPIAGWSALGRVHAVARLTFG